MGWRLAEEVAWARPQRPGPEWWTFMDIAQNANDDTRRGWPGREYLMARSKRSARTVDRYLRALIDANLIKRVRPASAGHRPVYEVLILFDMSTTRVTGAGARPNPQRAPALVARVVDSSGTPRASQELAHERAS